MTVTNVLKPGTASSINDVEFQTGAALWFTDAGELRFKRTPGNLHQWETIPLPVGDAPVYWPSQQSWVVQIIPYNCDEVLFHAGPGFEIDGIPYPYAEPCSVAPETAVPCPNCSGTQRADSNFCDMCGQPLRVFDLS